MDYITDKEFRAISHLTHKTHIDQVIDIIETDKGTKFYDYECEKVIPLVDGLKELYGGLAYSGKHDGLTDNECKAITDVMERFNIADKQFRNWFCSNADVDLDDTEIIVLALSTLQDTMKDCGYKGKLPDDVDRLYKQYWEQMLKGEVK